MDFETTHLDQQQDSYNGVDRDEKRVGTWPLRDLLEALDGTVVTDAAGFPQILYHGTFAQFDQFEITSDVGFHFGTWTAAQRRRKHAPLRPGGSKTEPRWQTIAVCLRLKNPLILHIDPHSWSEYSTLEAIKERISPDLLELIKARIRDHYGDRSAGDRAFDALVNAEMEKVTFTAAQVAREISKHGKSLSVYDERMALIDLGMRSRAKLSRRLKIDRPELFVKYQPMKIVRDTLIEAGFDGIGYVNFYEEKHSVSWVAFENFSIVQLARNEIVDQIDATEVEAEEAGYQCRANPLAPTRPECRTPNRDFMKRRDAVRLTAALVRVASAESKTFCSIKRIYIPGWEGRHEVSLICLGTRFNIKSGGKHSYAIPVNVCNDEAALTVEWPMYADPTEAAQFILTEIYRCAERRASRLRDESSQAAVDESIAASRF